MIDPSIATVLAAVIAAIAAGATAVYVGIASRTSSRQLTELQADLARHKEVTLEYVKAYINLEIEDRNQTLAAFKDLIRLVQLLREKMARVLKYPTAYAPDIAGSELVGLAKAVADCYAENQIIFEAFGHEADRWVVHSLKNDCGKIASLTHDYLAGQNQVQFNQLSELLADITAKQEELRMRARVRASEMLDSIKSRIDGRSK